MQIVSCSGDGLLKLWTIKTSECTATFDGHDGKIWALDGKYYSSVFLPNSTRKFRILVEVYVHLGENYKACGECGGFWLKKLTWACCKKLFVKHKKL